MAMAMANDGGQITRRWQPSSNWTLHQKAAPRRATI
jgi:hypothetical protein